MIGILHPVARPLAAPFGRALAARAFSWRNLFADGTPGFRINVEEAIRLNQQALGPELVVNGGFDSAAGWTLNPVASITGGKLNVGTAPAKIVATRTDAAIVPGRVYCVSFTLNVISGSNSVSAAVGGTVGDVINTSGRHTAVIVAGSTGTIHLQGRSTGTTNCTIDDFSVREIDLSKCVAFQDSAGTLPVTAMEQPLGYIKDLSGNGNHFIQPSNTASRPVVSRRVNLLTATTTLATQSVTTLAASHVLTFSGTGSVTLSGTATGTYSAGTHTITTTAGTLTVTVSGSVTNADLRLSVDAALPYQRVTSATDYDESGFPAYAKFDGVDDWLESGVVDMTSTDEVTVIAGVTKLVDTVGVAMLLELSANGTSIGGTLSVLAPGGNFVIQGYGFRSRGSSASGYANSGEGFQAPDKSLVTGVGKISEDLCVVRLNGIDRGQTTLDQGTGSYVNDKFYMGRRGGITNPFNGRIYGVTVVGKLLTDSQLAAAEQAERNLGRLW